MSTLAFVAGKSGGHILPALTLAQRHKQLFPEGTILFFSTSSLLDKQLLTTNKNIDIHIPLPLENVPYNKIVHLPRFIWHGLQSFFTSLKQLYRHKPSRVISMGGYISIPVCLAAYILRIPRELYELNAVPGKATRVLAPFATTITLCFKQATHYFNPKKIAIRPYPLRFTAIDKAITRGAALAALGLSPDKKTLLIIGGSQGSLFLNNMIKEYVEKGIDKDKLQIIHQTGDHGNIDWQRFYTIHNLPALVFGYRDDMYHCYRAADIIICRAGAGTLWEIVFFGTPALTIPLATSTTDHQLDNARAIADLYPHQFKVFTQDQITHNPKIWQEHLP